MLTSSPGGAFNINATGQEVLPRTSAMIQGNETIELRFTVTLPAAGRTVLGQQAWQILGVNLVELVRWSLLHDNLDEAKLQKHVYSVGRQTVLRKQLSGLGLISFIANGSILPRASGAVASPMDSSKAVLFQSPKEAEVTLRLPDGTSVSGMGIPKGITLLTGGGFHGKSTLLEAIQLGVYNHIPGDGRELIVTDPTAVKIRAEDGRYVSGVDIRPFISNLPGDRDTKRFSTDDASGSTSMATNIQEALEAGCKTLLIDEDSSATNLLVRDQRMQKLIQTEPITPLISKVRALYSEHGVSTVIVIGGLGDWLSVSDNVIAMDSYIPRIITNEAKAVIEQFPSLVAEDKTYGSLPDRKFRVDLTGYRSPYATRKNFITMNPESRNPVDDPAEAEPGIDLSGLDQVVEVGQARMIAMLLQKITNETARQP
jgi:predicted ABC-class ATPase